MPHLRAGQALGARLVDEEDALAARELATSLFFPGPASMQQDVFLFTQAFGFSSQSSCPALDAMGRCQVHDDRKPAVCSAVPLEPTWPDRLQGDMLAARHGEAAYLGADCITPKRSTLPLVTDGPSVVDAEARAALTRRRADLIAERRYWGERVARLLGPQLLSRPEQLQAIPEDGALTLSMVPVLAALAETSPRCHARTCEYVDAQTRLMERILSEANGTASPSEQAQLQAFLASNRGFGKQLQRGPLARSPVPPELSAAIEHWLELTPA